MSTEKNKIESLFEQLNNSQSFRNESELSSQIIAIQNRLMYAKNIKQITELERIEYMMRLNKMMREQYRECVVNENDTYVTGLERYLNIQKDEQKDVRSIEERKSEIQMYRQCCESHTTNDDNRIIEKTH